jgi:flagellar motor protein MotB
VGRRETFVKFERGSFEGKKDNLSLKIDENSMVTTIRDDTFLYKVKSAEVRPSNVETIKVKMRKSQGYKMEKLKQNIKFYRF